mgnify:CR=1 FL=1
MIHSFSKKTKVVLFCLLISLKVFAQQITEVEARKAALNFIKPRATAASKGDFQINTVGLGSKNGMALLYKIRLSPTGFVVLSADRTTTPVIGYSLDEPFGDDGQNPAAADFLTDWETDLEATMSKKDAKSAVSQKNQQLWAQLLGETSAPENGILGIVGPLCQTTWNQGCDYNAQCPIATGGPCGRVWAGCGATALAQLLKYYNWPYNGVGSNSYDSPGFGTQSVNFGAASYDWGAMPNSLNGPNTEVAKLMYHCAVAMNMTFGAGGSSSFTNSTLSAAVDHFGYSSLAGSAWKDWWGIQDWQNFMLGEIDQFRPMLYRGANPGGHIWVMDGYDTNGGTSNPFYHMNWGWGGYQNGFFQLNNANGYNTDQIAIFFLQPKQACAASQSVNYEIYSNPIEFEVHDQVTGNAAIFNNANVTFEAGQKIVLEPGFEAQSGSIFHSFIEGCAGEWYSFQSFNYPGNYIRHFDFYGRINPIFSALDRQDATFKMVAGLDPSCPGGVSFESKNYPGQYLIKENDRLRIASTASGFNKKATFSLKPGLANADRASLESWDAPGYYVRHKNGLVYVEPFVNSDLFKQDATFKLTQGLW